MRGIRKSNFSILICCIGLLACKKEAKELEDMVFFKGGEIEIGCKDKDCRENEVPVFKTHIEPFYLDKHVVSVADFQKFIEKTGYKTDAEKFGDAGVLNFKTGDWELVKGAFWKYPLGKDSKQANSSHPVTQVSWNDACSYCKYLEKRLPSNNEWEYAATFQTNENERYSWGEHANNDTAYYANVWQGEFPFKNLALDGYELTAPIGMFGKTKTGLTDMGGNVWQWCNDTYAYYKGNSTPFEIKETDKVIRGGSFLCDSNVCFSYRKTARNFCSQETALFHMGFRCAKSIDNLKH